MVHRTTLGIPLTEEEYQRMESSLISAKTAIASIPLGLEPTDLLRSASLIIDCGFNLRDHIQRGLNEANQRGVKAQLGGHRRHLKVVPTKEDTEIQADINEILDVLKRSW